MYSKKPKNKDVIPTCSKCCKIQVANTGDKCTYCKQDRNNKKEYWRTTNKALARNICCDHCREQHPIADERRVCFACYVDETYGYDNR